jgi:hypothetical protein
MAGGYIAPLLRAAGWETTLVCRNQEVLRAINAGGGLWLRIAGEPEDLWVGGVSAVPLGGEGLIGEAARGGPRRDGGRSLVARRDGPVVGAAPAPPLR